MVRDITNKVARYRTEALGFAEELIDLLDHDQYAYAEELMAEHGLEAFIRMTEADLEAALSFLAKTPSERQKVLDRRNWQEGLFLVLRARYLGLLAANGLETVEAVLYELDGPYRRSMSRIARSLIQGHGSLDEEDLLPPAL